MFSMSLGKDLKASSWNLYNLGQTNSHEEEVCTGEHFIVFSRKAMYQNLISYLAQMLINYFTTSTRLQLLKYAIAIQPPQLFIMVLQGMHV